MQVETELKAAGLTDQAITAILATMQARSLDNLAQMSGSSNVGVAQLQSLFKLAEGYGYQDWLVFDASIVRGLAYYTGKQRTIGSSLSGCTPWHCFEFCLLMPAVLHICCFYFLILFLISLLDVVGITHSVAPCLGEQDGRFRLHFEHCKLYMALSYASSTADEPSSCMFS